MKGYAGSPSKAKKTATPKWVQDKYDKKRAKYDQQDDRVLYQTARWRRVRNSYIRRNPLCERCKVIGITSEARIVDHIIPVNSNGARWDERNLMSLCQDHHNAKTNKEQTGWIIQAKEANDGQLIPKDRGDALKAY